jgi:hypothetical protein
MRPHCAFCCAHPGWIVYGWEHTGANTEHLPGDPVGCNGCYEVLAPCPFCDKGRSVELVAYGDNGFWQDHTPTPVEIDESCRCHERPLGRHASTQRLDELKLKLKEHLGMEERRRQDALERSLENRPAPVTATQSRGIKLGLLPPDTNSKAPISDDEIGTLL